MKNFFILMVIFLAIISTASYAAFWCQYRVNDGEWVTGHSSNTECIYELYCAEGDKYDTRIRDTGTTPDTYQRLGTLWGVARRVGTDGTWGNQTVPSCCNDANDCLYASKCWDNGLIAGSIPNRHYCNNGIWQGGDAGSTRCTAIKGSGYWALGGEVAASNCCGDDTNEFRISGSGYIRCCNASIDCVDSTGTCRDGTELCGADGKGDGIDNDCNGQTDEICECNPSDTRQCGPNTEDGPCEYGTQTCQPDETWGDCIGGVYPINELCVNGIDDDCDNSTDEVECCGNGDDTDPGEECEPPSTYLSSCDQYGATYLQDSCDYKCELQDGSTCESGYAGCTSYSGCDGIAPETCIDTKTICTSDCQYEERDNNQNYCTDSTGCVPFSWIPSGEDGVGEYDFVGDVECCGDDFDEFSTYYNMGATGGCNDITIEECIGLPDNTSDIACCNNQTDCVFQKTCYPISSLLDIDGDLINGEFCSQVDDTEWKDCDISQNACENTCGYTYVMGGENNTFGEYDEGSSTECCGDDADESVNWRQVSSQTKFSGYEEIYSNPSDRACCQSPNSCVFNGKCYMDVDDVKTLYGVTDVYDSPYRNLSYFDLNNDSALEMCDPGNWTDPYESEEGCEDMGGVWIKINGEDVCYIYIPPGPPSPPEPPAPQEPPDPNKPQYPDPPPSEIAATFYGKVDNIDGFNISGALVEFIGTSKIIPGTTIWYYTYTNSSGNYLIYVLGNATYDILVSKQDYQSSSKIIQYIKIQDTKQVNFTLISSYEQCTQDCTFQDDEYCHASCDGRVGCQFNSTQTKNICNGKVSGWVVDYNTTHEIICCESSPHEKRYLRVVKIQTGIDIKNIVRIIRLVILRGKPAKMIVDTFG